jgi:glycosyltransferase involved in cell wall biosynthesis
LKICIISQQMRNVISGPGLHANLLTNSLMKDGHDVTVILPEDQCPEREPIFKLTRVPKPRFAYNQARWISLSYHFGKALHTLEKKEKFDLIHFTDAREALFCPSQFPRIGNANDTYAAELYSLGHYRQNYNDWFKRWAYYKFVHACERWTFPRLDAIIANSLFTSKILAKNYKLNASKLFTCYKSVDKEVYRKSFERHERPSQHPPRVLFVGGNMQRKGLPTLISSARQVIQALPNCEFWVVGRDTAETNMRLLCEQNKVADHFNFLGWKSQADLINIYAQADLFVMPSLVEALGVAFLEAMAAGVVVIGTPVGGITEIIEDGYNGRLTPVKNDTRLAEVIIEVLSLPELQHQYRFAALKTVDDFSIEKMMKNTYQIYQQVLAKRKIN